MSNNPSRQFSTNPASAPRSALRQRLPGARACLATLLILALLGFSQPSSAQVSLPNGGVSENVVDLRVKTIGGLVTVDRQFEEGRWHINLRWAPAVLSGEAVGSVTCKAYPELKIQGHPYTGDGLSWLRENRYSARVTGYFDGSDCPANRLKTIRWQDRNSGQWMEYERSSTSDLQLKLVRYGNRNDIATQLLYDPQGKLQSVKDHHGNTVLHYLYTGDQLTEIRDNPGLIPGNTAAARAVKYTYTNVTNAQGVSYPTISQVTDVLGNVTRYTYTGTYLATLTDPEGRIRRYDYTADRVTQYTDAEGNVTRYVYDYDKLKKEFYVRTTYPATVAGSRILEQWYDLDGRVVRRDVNGQSEYRKGPTDTATRSETRADGAGRQTVTTQDEYGNTIKTVYPDGSTTSAKYSAVHGQVTEETDELGIKTTYDYDSQGNLTRKTEAVGLPEQRITEYAVNHLGQLSKETRKGQGGAPDASVSYAYDNRGNRVEMTDPLGKTSSYTYDIQGDVSQLTDAAGRIWQAEHNAAGRLTARIDPLGHRAEVSYDKVGNRIQSKDALGNLTRFTFNAQNRVTQIINPLGGTRTSTYDAQGCVIAEINEAGQTVSRSTYNAQGQLVSTQDAAGNAAQYRYDPSLTPFAPVSIQHAGVTRDMRFDSADRIIEQTESWSEGSTTRSASSKNVYDKKGRLIEYIDRLGNKTQLAYDGLDRLISVTDAQGGVTQFSYDARDNLLSLTDANGNTTRFEYDANNRKTQETRPLGQRTTYTYDAIGQLTEAVDAQGNKQRYTYDNAGRANKEERLNAAGQLTRTITYSYNALGTLTGITDSNTGHADHQAWRSEITVDALQRKTKETITLGNQTVSFDTTYSATGRKASQSLADGTLITYSYDQNGGDGKGTDELNAIELPGTGTISIGNRHWGQPKQITYPGGSQRQNDYDALLRLQKIQLKSAGQQSLMQRQYSFDAESNITGLQTEYGSIAYGYDNLYRLTQVTPSISSGLGLPNERYTYDKLGNRLTDSQRPNPNQGNTAWRYDGNNQLLESATEDTGLLISNSQAISHQYDANGSLIQKSSPANDPYHNQKYQYDAGNRLTEVQTPSGDKIASYQYDPLGRRIRKTEYRELNGGNWQALATPRTTTFYYADEGLAAEYEQSGNNPAELKTQYGWEPNGMWGTSPLFLKTTRTGQTTPEYFYAQNDHLGTPQQLIDQAGEMVWAQRAEVFGKTSVVIDTVTNNLRFPGQYYDRETNTHYNYFRDYEPSAGRYIQKDPIGLGGGINIYLYVDGNPLSSIDPTGEIVIPVFVYYGAAALVGAIIANAARGGSKGKRSDDPFDGATGARPSSGTSSKPERSAEDEKKAQAEHDWYKSVCENKRPPSGDRCQDILNEANRAEACSRLMSDWDEKWQPGRHASDIVREFQRHKRLMREYAECKKECS